MPPTEPAPITAKTTVREAVSRYAGIESIFDKHGIMGCGGPDGPLEPIAFFARIHKVPPEQLLKELNEYATSSGATPAAPDATAQRSFYFIPIVAAVVLAIGVGFPLGILAAYSAVHDIGINTRWAALVQAHGHLQVLGWVGLFIMGVAYHILPRFKGVPLQPSSLVWPSFLFLVAGLALRTGAQPWGEVDWVAPLMVISGGLELAGVIAFAAVVITTLLAGQREPYEAFLITGILWLLASAIANLAVLADIASDRVPVISGTSNEPLMAMQFYGFIVLFIFGVSLRVLPFFLDLRPARASLFIPLLALLNAGLLLRVVPGWLEGFDVWNPPAEIDSAGGLLLAASLLVFPLALNLHLPSVKSDIADMDKGYVKLIRAAYLWLAVAAGIEVWLASRLLLNDQVPNALEVGGIRHALALGFITQMIFGMGSRALPVFAGKRLFSPRLLTAAFVLINITAVTRVFPAVVDVGSITSRFNHITYAGIVGLIAVILFAYNIVRTVRIKPPATSAVTTRQTPIGDGPISGDMLVSDILDRVPGSLELLIDRGFTPLANPIMRQTLTRRVTLATGCRMRNIDLQQVLDDLNRLAGATGPSDSSTRDEGSRDATTAASAKLDSLSHDGPGQS